MLSILTSQCRISSGLKLRLSRHCHSQSSILPSTLTPDHLLQLCLRHCQIIQSRQLLDEMPETVSVALKASKSVHARCFRFGYGLDGRLGNAVVDLYAKCGSLVYGERAFDSMETKHVLGWNSVMSMYSKSSDSLHLVLSRFIMFMGTGISPNRFTIAIVLSACSKLLNLVAGKQVHGSLIKGGFEFVSFCEGSLIDMYAKCCSISDARRVFDSSVEADVVSWTAMISGYVYVDKPEEALNVYNEMLETNKVPDQVTFITVLSACVKLGRFDDACSLFYRMPEKNVIAWNTMISGYAKKGYEAEAVVLFISMQNAGIQGTRSTLGSVLSAIANTEALDCGLIVHAQAIKQGLDANVYVGSSLINMYAKCGKVEAAKSVFDSLEERNLVLWNAMLGGYAQNGCASDVMGLYDHMKKNGVRPDEFTYTSILSACACLGYLQVGHQMHTYIIKNKLDSNLFVGNALVDMYAKSGSLEDSKRQFERIRNRDKVSWNAIIVGYVQEQEEEMAFDMFKEMAVEGIAPDEVTLASILSACANVKILEFGKQVHGFAVKFGLDMGLYAGSSLVDMYAKCGALQASLEVLNSMPRRSSASMNALISGYSQCNVQEAVTLFQNMQEEGLEPSEVTFAALLNACDSPKLSNLGMQIHSLVIKMCLLSDVEFLGVSLISMYVNCLRNKEATALFYEFPSPKSAILWTALISGYTQNDGNDMALQLYQEMRSESVMPDQATFASVLKACSMLASLVDGRLAHSLIVHTGYSSDELAGSALIDMYAKCGDVTSSIQVFDEMISKSDVISWNSMIVGLAKNGHADKALAVFDEMIQMRISPDDVTLLGVLTACSHSGKVSKGRKIFDTLVSFYKIKPRVEHCACMVDLLGRWGFLTEAEEFIDNLDEEFKNNAMLWSTMLGACNIHGNERIGKRAAKQLTKFEPQNHSPYVLLANIHAKAGNWDEVNSVRKEMNKQGVIKIPGCSWIAVGQKTHSFVAGDKSHPSTSEMSAALKDLVASMKDYGFVGSQVSQMSHLQNY